MAGRRQRAYTEGAKAAALAVLDANGGNVSLAMRDLADADIPRSTLRSWAKNRDGAAPAETRHEKRIEAADVYRSIESKAGGLLDRALDIIAPATVAGDPRYLTALNTVAGTATDKRQLLTNGPTVIVEHHDLTDAEAVEAARRWRLLEGGKAKRTA